MSHWTVWAVSLIFRQINPFDIDIDIHRIFWIPLRNGIWKLGWRGFVRHGIHQTGSRKTHKFYGSKKNVWTWTSKSRKRKEYATRFTEKFHILPQEHIYLSFVGIQCASFLLHENLRFRQKQNLDVPCQRMHCDDNMEWVKKVFFFQFFFIESSLHSWYGNDVLSNI